MDRKSREEFYRRYGEPQKSHSRSSSGFFEKFGRFAAKTVTSVLMGLLAGVKFILSELLSFIGSRAATWILGWLLNMLMVNVLGISVFVSTVVVGILVVIGNYVFSKLLVFRSKKPEENP